jgi:hypothetical protein
MNDESVKNELENQVNSVLESLSRDKKEYEKKHFDLGDWLNENVLEIKREQSLVEGRWETNKYILVFSYGGPYIEIDTEGKIYGYWAGEKVEKNVSGDALDFLMAIEEYLLELEGA